MAVAAPANLAAKVGDAPRQFRPPGWRPRATRKAEADARRASAWKRGYDATWYEFRDAWIREHPLCCECEAGGLSAAAEHVDHVIPFDGVDDPLRLDPENVQSLCRPCHSRKTAGELGWSGPARAGPKPAGVPPRWIPRGPRPRGT